MKDLTVGWQDPGYDRVDLAALLRAIRGQTEKLTWSVQLIEGVGDITGVVQMRMLAFEKACMASPCGVVMPLDQIVRLVGACDDIIELVIVACEKTIQVPKAYVDSDWEEACSVIIERDDSSMWRFYGKDPTVMRVFEALSNNE